MSCREGLVTRETLECCDQFLGRLVVRATERSRVNGCRRAKASLNKSAFDASLFAASAPQLLHSRCIKSAEEKCLRVQLSSTNLFLLKALCSTRQFTLELCEKWSSLRDRKYATNIISILTHAHICSRLVAWPCEQSVNKLSPLLTRTAACALTLASLYELNQPPSMFARL